MVAALIVLFVVIAICIVAIVCNLKSDGDCADSEVASKIGIDVAYYRDHRAQIDADLKAAEVAGMSYGQYVEEKKYMPKNEIVEQQTRAPLTGSVCNSRDIEVLLSIRTCLRWILACAIILIIMKGCDGTTKMLNDINDGLNSINDGVRAPRTYHGEVRSY